MNLKMMVWCLFLALTAFSQSISLIAPNGGETFSAGQGITIKWSQSNVVDRVSLEVSYNNGASWSVVREGIPSDSGICTWTPYSKNRIDQALIRISADNAAHQPSDVSNSSFQILGSSVDGYEPNNNFQTACPISVGDSVVKNAFCFGQDSLQTDSSLFDVDYYKVTLDSGKLATISLIPWDTCCFGPQDPYFAIYDSSKSLVFHKYIPQWWESSSDLIGYNVAKSGTYYLKIGNTNYYTGMSPTKYGLSIHERIPKPIAIISPNGNESFSAGQPVTIRWTADSSFHKFSLGYSCNNGVSWRQITWATFQVDTFSWLVPPLKNTANRTLIRVIATNIANPLSDVSDGNFTILKSPPDAYEPNNDFASAFPISIGDSTVKNAVVGEIDTMDGDTTVIASDTLISGTDADYYKVFLTAKKLTTITAHWAIKNDYTQFRSPGLNIQLYDSLKNQVPVSNMQSWNISHAGTYYCVVSAYFGEWAKYNLSIRQSDGTITLISPNGGEQFNAGQEVKVRWNSDSLINQVSLSYSLNNGTTWNFFASEISDSGHYSWIVPPLLKRTDKALVRVNAGYYDSTLFDVSNGTFTIQASAPDVYEPNNDFSTAYSVAIGDSVVKNATIYGCRDTTYYDDDYYKVTLSAGKLITISMMPTSSNTYEYGGSTRSTVGLFNASTNQVAHADFQLLNYYTTQPGIYYCYLAFPHGYSGSWAKYNLSIRSATVLSKQRCMLDTTAMQRMVDTTNGAYKLQLISDTTKLTVNLTLRYIRWGSIEMMILAPDDLPIVPNIKVKVKAVAILDYSDLSSSLTTMDISIPYNLSDLKGYPENMLAAFLLNDVTGQWTPVASSLDSVKHQITVHGTNAGTYGVFVKSNTAIGNAGALLATANGIKANFLPQKQSIAVHLSLLKAAHAEVCLYDILGKCVKKSSFEATRGLSTLLLNPGSIGIGKYFLTVKAGAYYAKEPILIMK